MNIMTFSALSEPNRLRIVELLRTGPSSVGNIADRLVLRQPLVSNHLRVLSEAGLVTVRPVAQRRIYELRVKPFKDLGNWVETFDRIWNERMDVFEARLEDMKAQAKHVDTSEEV